MLSQGPSGCCVKGGQAETRERGDQLRGFGLHPGERPVAGANRSSEGGECILRVWPILSKFIQFGFSDGLDRGCERKRGLRGDPRIWGHGT